MAIVANAANEIAPADKSFCTPNRTNAGSPVSSVTPQYAGEIIMDTTNGVRWRAWGAANTNWYPLDTEITA